MKLRQALSLLLILLFAILLIWYVSDNWSSFQSLKITQPYLLIIGLVLVVFTLYSSGSVNETAMEPHGVKLTKHEILGLTAVTRFLGQFFPSYVSASARALYFKKKRGVSYAKFSSSFALTNIMQLAISGLIACTIYLSSGQTIDKSSAILLVFLITIVITLLIALPTGRLFLALYKLITRYKTGFLERLAAVPVEYSKVKAYPNTLIKTFFWIIVSLILSSLLLVLLYRSLGYDIAFIKAVFIASLLTWSVVLSITPAGIGIREGLMVIAAQIVDVPINETLAVALLLRLVTILTTSLISSYYSPRLFGQTLFKLGRHKSHY